MSLLKRIAHSRGDPKRAQIAMEFVRQQRFHETRGHLQPAENNGLASDRQVCPLCQIRLAKNENINLLIKVLVMGVTKKDASPG